MKGAYILLEKNGMLIRTQFTSKDSVQWLEGESRLIELTHAGYTVVKDNLVNIALNKLETVRDRLCSGVRVKNEDLIDIIKILKEF